MAADSVVMIRPMNFGYNEETAQSNSFQHTSTLPANEVQKRALNEFEALARKIEDAGIGLKIFNDTVLPRKPDAIFPNNWISTHANGTVILYPMQSPLRRLERRDDIVEWLRSHFHVTRIVNLAHFEQQGKFLEGTGSLVFDHNSKKVYASVSNRTCVELMEIVAEELDYTPFVFKASDKNRNRVYHTNVIMGVGEKLAVVCNECITEGLDALTENLSSSGKEILEINYKQLESFAGNVLFLQNKKEKNFIVMSEKARNSLSAKQIQQIETYATVLSGNLETIETTGGGSARCMIAENFLPRKM